MTTPSPDLDRPTWVCPQCQADAYLCNKSDHGAVNGPALHCRERPTHNEFDLAEFGRWETST